MFIYKKSLQYPVKIDKPNPRLASIILSQYGGPYSQKIYNKRHRISGAALFYGIYGRLKPSGSSDASSAWSAL